MKTGTILLKLRKNSRLSQAEVAERLGVGQSTYCAWESDRSMPNTKWLVSLANIFGVEVNQLICQHAGFSPTLSNVLKVKPEARPLYEDLTATQKQLILLQQEKIGQLESQNLLLRRRVQHLEEKLQGIAGTN